MATTAFPQDIQAALDSIAPMPDLELPDDIGAALDRVAPTTQQKQPTPSLEGLKIEPDRGVGGDLLKVLSYLSYPLHGVAGAIESGISEDPQESAVGGFVKGITGERKTRMKDVLGLDEGRPDDTWPEWLGKEGLNFLVDLPFDPLTYVGTPAKAGGIIGKGLFAAGIPEGRSLISHGARKLVGDEALNKLAGTKLWAMLGQKMPDTEIGRKINEIAMAVRRRGSSVGLEDAAVEANRLLKEKFPDLDRETLFNAIENPDKYPELAEAIGIYSPVAQEQAQQFGKYSGLKEYFTGIAPQKQAEPYVPHVSMERGEWKPRSREIRDFVDEDGNVLFTGKLSDERTTKVIKPVGDGKYEFHDPTTGDITLVEEGPASLATTKQVAKDIKFQTDPVLAQFVSGKGYAKRAQFLDYLKELEQAGFIKKIAPDATTSEGNELLSFAGLDLKDKWEASKAVARNIEQQFGRLYNPDAPMGTISTALDQMFNRTKAGELLKEGTGWWKRNILGAPGWTFGNIGSNLGLQYQGSMNPLVMISRAVQGEKVRRGVGEAVIDGLDNKQLLRELRDRGIGTNQFSEADKSYLSGFTPKTAERLSALRPSVAKGAQKAANAMGAYNDLWLRMGGAAEDNAKIGMAIDFLKKHADEWGNPANRENLLDRAAQESHDALIDYGAGTPWESRVAKNIIPFEPWLGGITRRTAKLAMDDPARLARMDRALQGATEPLSDDEKRIADRWVKESAPIKGAFGKSFDKWADDLGLPKLPRGQRMLLLSRFLPQGTIEQLFSRPADMLVGSINPALKAPYEAAANWNTFKDRPIDQLADGLGKAFTAPITGDAYSPATSQVFGATLPAGYEYLLSLSPASRHTAELNQLGQAVGLWGDKYKAEAPSLPEFGAWYATGGKFYPYDPSKYQKNRDREKREKENRFKSAWKWAASHGDYYTANRLRESLSDYRRERGRVYSSGEY